MPRAFLFTHRRYSELPPAAMHPPTSCTDEIPEHGVEADCPDELYNLTQLAEVSLAAAAADGHVFASDLRSRDAEPEPEQASCSSSGGNHVCQSCGKRYSTSSNLARHRQTHRSPDDKKARRCPHPHCGKLYVSMPAFSMHVRTHNQACRCPACGKCFSRPWLLQGHLRTHTGEHLQPEYEAINPFKKVPCISHNDFTLTESVAILRYLCREFNVADHWYPKDSILQAKVDEFIEWQHIELRVPLAMYFQYKFLRPMLSGKPANEANVGRMYKMMIVSCDKIENIWLKNTPYLCGNSISIADLVGACEVEQPRMAGYDPVEGRPKMKQWMDRVKTDLDPFYREAHTFLNAVVAKHGGRIPESISKL